MKEKLKRIIKKYYKHMIVFICLILTLEMVNHLFANNVMKRDILGYKFISTYLIKDITIPIAKFITTFGGVLWLIVFTIVLAIILIKNKHKLIGKLVILNLALSGLLNQILKRIVQRPRPEEYRLIDESGYSFPSGHSMVSAAVYGFLIYLIFKHVKSKKQKIILIPFLVILISVIGVSRIYLGVHYTSDVLAGFLISISYLVIFTSIANEFIDEEVDNIKKNNNTNEKEEEI